jgi:hypothetical protein
MSKEEKMKYLATIGLLTALTAGASAYAADCPQLTKDQISEFAQNPNKTMEINGTKWSVLAGAPSDNDMKKPLSTVKLTSEQHRGADLCIYHVEDASHAGFTVRIQTPTPTNE